MKAELENIDKVKALAKILLQVQLVICTGYFIVFLFIIEITFSKFFLPSLLAASFITLIFWWKGRLVSAIIFDLIAVNVFLFLLSERMGVPSGVDLYFVPVGAAALALFGHERWQIGVGFAMVSTILFISSRMIEFQTIPAMPLGESEARTLFLINAVLAMSIAIYCVYTVMSMYYSSEARLKQIRLAVERQNEELTKKNTELDSFVYSASHDLKSPLSSIKGLVHLMQMEGTTKEELRDYLNKIRDRADAMEKFLKELTLYSRNTRMEVRMEFFVLKPVIAEIVEGIQSTRPHPPVLSTIDIPDDFVVRADLYRLTVAVSNLINNAFKYIDPSKSKCEVKIRAFQNGHYAIEVEDNGIGIKQEQLPKIFNMFYRATEKSSGSGLGLYIAHESVAKMNGRITVDSEFGVGTKFLVTLPKNVN